MKKCPVCKKKKSDSEFNKKKDGLSSYCRKCSKAYLKKHYRKNTDHYAKKRKDYQRKYHEWFNNLKLKYPCAKCGESHPACIDFHHKASVKKDAPVSSVVRRYGPKKVVIAEIKKCVPLCANCHRKLHFK